MFEIEDLFELSLDGAFQSLEEFKDFANSADYETLFSVITPGAFKDLEEFKSSLVEKKNPIVTPSDGEEVLTESTTETEVQDGVSDSLEVNEVVEEGVINESQLNFGDQTGPIVEEKEEVLIPDAPNRKGVLENKDGSVPTHKMRTETYVF